MIFLQCKCAAHSKKADADQVSNGRISICASALEGWDETTADQHLTSRRKHLSAFLAAIPAFLSAVPNVCPHSLAGRCFDSGRGGTFMHAAASAGRLSCLQQESCDHASLDPSIIFGEATLTFNKDLKIHSSCTDWLDWEDG